MVMFRVSDQFVMVLRFYSSRNLKTLVTFTLPASTLAVLVLSRLDERYFRDISARSDWNLNFVLVKEGETEPLAESVHAMFWTRSVNLEIELEAGKYFVHVRLKYHPRR